MLAQATSYRGRERNLSRLAALGRGEDESAAHELDLTDHSQGWPGRVKVIRTHAIGRPSLGTAGKGKAALDSLTRSFGKHQGSPRPLTGPAGLPAMPGLA